MPLRINIRHLLDRDVHVEGELPISELDLQVQDDQVQVTKPLIYNVTAQKLGSQILVQGRLSLTLDCECVRCLKKFQKPLEFPQWVAHLPLEGPEKVPIDNDCVDLTPFIREDILLEFPQHPLCETDCAGLPNRSEQNEGKSSTERFSEWSKLNKLKF